MDALRNVELTVVQLASDGYELAGKKIAETDLARRVGLLIVALRHVGQEGFVYSPDGDHVLEPGCIVVVIGPVGRVQLLEELALPR